MRSFVAVFLCFISMVSVAQEATTPLRANVLHSPQEKNTLHATPIPQPSFPTGAASFQLPLYTIEAEGLEIPLTLSYHSSGVKVLDNPGTLGFGWSIEPSFVATRTILGRPDELFPDATSQLLDENTKNRPLLAYYTITNYGESERCDSERDIINIPLPGKRLTRILKRVGESMQFLGVGDDEYKVSTPDNLKTIVVRDPKGNIYYFGKSYETIKQVGTMAYRYVPVAWGLDRIELPSGREIEFKWSKYVVESVAYTGGTVVADAFNFNGIYTKEIEEKANPLATQFHVERNHVDSALCISSIKFPGGDINFIYKKDPQPGINRLISIFFSKNTIVPAKRISFGTENAGYRGFVLRWVDIPEIGKYKFDYDIKIFDDIYSQDLWGYYNGVTNIALHPAMTITKRNWAGDSAGIHTIPGANRRVECEAMLYNQLHTIHYPGGGYTHYEYEPHRFSPVQIDNAISSELNAVTLSYGGGLRIKSISHYTSKFDSSPQIVSYQYSNAQVRAVPTLDTFIDVYKGLTSSGVCPSPLYARLICILPQSDYMRYDFNELPIWYKDIEEIHAEGKRSYKYGYASLSRNYIRKEFGKRTPQLLSSLFSAGPVIKSAKTFKGSDGNYELVNSDEYQYTEYHKDSDEVCAYINRRYIQFGTNSDHAPDFDRINSSLFLRGLGYGTPDYDMTAEDDILEEYTKSNGETGYRTIYHDPTCPYDINSYSISFITERLIGVNHTEYNGDTKHTTSKRFEYLDGTSLISSTTEISPTTTTVTSYEYPSQNSMGASKEMYNSNVLMPLNVTVNSNGTIVTTTNKYTNINNRVFRPRETLSWHTGKADTIFSPIYTYDNYGNAISSIDRDGIKNTTLYDASFKYPVVQISGLTTEDLPSDYLKSALTKGASPAEIPHIPYGLVTTCHYEPFIGITSSRSTYGRVDSCTYDTKGRISETSIVGHGVISRNNYYGNDGSPAVNTIESYTDGAGNISKIDKVFFDGLGRKTLAVENSDANQNEDAESNPQVLSTRYKYDYMGRLIGTLTPGNELNDNSAWTDNFYEPSPRNVLESTLTPGREWKEADRRKHYLLTPSTDLYCKILKTDDAGNVSVAGYYKAGDLMVEKVTDEDGFYTTNYKTASGKVVLSDKNGLTTRYIYDNIDRLRYVLPPNINAVAMSASNTDLHDYAYRYDYDLTGHVVCAKAPGQSESRYVYSPAGRLVAEQTPLIPNGKWRVHLYDRHGRETITFITTLSDSELSKIKSVACTANFNINAGNEYYYDLSALGLSDKIIREKILYYDDYRFTGNYEWLPAADNNTLAAPQGLPTGSVFFDNSQNSQHEVNRYDAIGRQTQVIRRLSGRTTIRDIDYTYCSHINSERVRYYIADSLAHQYSIEYTYDSFRRPRAVTYTADGKSATVNTAYNTAGLVDSIIYNSYASRKFSYDIGGRKLGSTTRLKREYLSEIKYPSFDFYSAIGSSQLTSAATSDALLPGRPGIIWYDTFTESFSYTDSSAPKYNGTPSAYTSTLGGRYDYRFDSYDRLIAANYSSNKSAEDFSVSYSYDILGRPTNIKRFGVVDIDGSTEEFGILDRLSLEYGGATLYHAECSEYDGVDFYQRTGWQGAEAAQYDFNNAGLLIADEARNIKNITYDYRGLPTSVFKSKGTGRLAPGTYLDFTYDAAGNKISEREYLSADALAAYHSRSMLDGVVYSGYTRKVNTSSSPGGILDLAQYVTVDTLERIDLGAVYFDSKLEPHFRLYDMRGNVDMVVDGKGVVEQHNGYYPYGEPWREPAGNALLHDGKERLRTLCRGDYNYGPRILHSPLALWMAPDPLAHQTPHTSPYTVCAANPVRFADPSGLRPTPYEAALMCDVAYNFNRSSNTEELITKELRDTGWQLSTNRKYNKNQDDFINFGMQGLLFERTVNNKTEYTYAYAGSEQFIDFTEDFLQLFGASIQYFNALITAKRLSYELNGLELTFVGHSLGGGEAAVASMGTGRHAITFNPASVSKNTRIGFFLFDSSKITNYRVYTNRIGNYYYGGCIVNSLQDAIGISAPGITIPLLIPGKNPIESHLLQTILDYYNENQ